MTRGELFMKKAKCKHGYCGSLSNSARCDLNSKCDALKLHDICHIFKCKCQKTITFTPHQYMLEGGSIKSKHQKILGVHKLLGINF